MSNGLGPAGRRKQGVLRNKVPSRYMQCASAEGRLVVNPVWAVRKAAEVSSLA